MLVPLQLQPPPGLVGQLHRLQLPPLQLRQPVVPHHHPRHPQVPTIALAMIKRALMAIAIGSTSALFGPAI